MKLDVVFINQNDEFKRVIIKGDDNKINMYLWKILPTPPSKDNLNIDDYISMRKFMRESYQDITPDYKIKLFSSITLHTKPKNTYMIWCHKDSEI